jgi:small subunit ribosomal protein S20
VLSAIESGDKSAAETAYKAVVPAIDRSVSKGLMHRNKAARHKSRLNDHVRNM